MGWVAYKTRGSALAPGISYLTLLLLLTLKLSTYSLRVIKSTCRNITTPSRGFQLQEHPSRRLRRTVRKQSKPVLKPLPEKSDETPSPVTPKLSRSPPCPAISSITYRYRYRTSIQYRRQRRTQHRTSRQPPRRRWIQQHPTPTHLPSQPSTTSNSNLQNHSTPKFTSRFHACLPLHHHTQPANLHTLGLVAYLRSHHSVRAPHLHHPNLPPPPPQNPNVSALQSLNPAKSPPQ
jgi:hypothetical protein